jgi:hypothetical protein
MVVNVGAWPTLCVGGRQCWTSPFSSYLVVRVLFVFKYERVAENKTKFSELQRRHTEKNQNQDHRSNHGCTCLQKRKDCSKRGCGGWIHKINLVAGREKRPTSIDIEEKHFRDFAADPPYVGEGDTNLPCHLSMEVII